MKYRRSSWWKKFKERIASFLTAKKKEEEKGKERKAERVTKRPERDKLWENLEDGCFSLCFLGQNWLCVNAAAEGLQKRTDGKVAAAGSSG